MCVGTGGRLKKSAVLCGNAVHSHQSLMEESKDDPMLWCRPPKTFDPAAQNRINNMIGLNRKWTIQFILILINTGIKNV